MTDSGKTIILTEPVPALFDFGATVRAHGWLALRPFAWHEPSLTLYRVQSLSGGTVVRLGLRETPANGHVPGVQIEVDTAAALTPRDEAEIRRAVRRMLRLDEDLTEFYRLYQQLPGWNLRLPPGGGRLLRCPSLFEETSFIPSVLPTSPGRAPNVWWNV
ncbi:MAG: hypothetical protein U0401_01985 [Anaerolineae bacterium]